MLAYTLFLTIYASLVYKDFSPKIITDENENNMIESSTYLLFVMNNWIDQNNIIVKYTETFYVPIYATINETTSAYNIVQSSYAYGHYHRTKSSSYTKSSLDGTPKNILVTFVEVYRVWYQTNTEITYENRYVFLNDMINEEVENISSMVMPNLLVFLLLQLFF